MVENNFISDVKKKKEFSGLPDSVVERALTLNKDNIKETRAFLRKYFGVFLTNKVIKGRDENILASHISSKKRDYLEFYSRIFENEKNFKSVLDIGCGANGFSYGFLKKVIGDVNYLGLEASNQIIESTNQFFKTNNFSSAKCVQFDILELDSLLATLKSNKSPKAIFLFQVIDALEKLEPNFSKILLKKISENLKEEDLIVISNPTKSISGKNKFFNKRNWLADFFEENFKIVDSFEMFDEELFLLKIK